eukprot:UN15337
MPQQQQQPLFIPNSVQTYKPTPHIQQQSQQQTAQTTIMNDPNSVNKILSPMNMVNLSSTNGNSTNLSAT